MKKIAVIQFWNGSPHFEISLEIAMNLALTEINKVSYHFWGKCAYFNEIYIRSEDDNSREKRAKALTNNIIHWNQDMPIHYPPERINKIYLKSIAHLKRMKYSNYFVGEYIACSLIDLSKLPSPDPRKFELTIQAMLRSFISVFLSTQKVIDDYGINEIILFNGRHINDAAAHCAAMSRGVSTRFHERGGSDDKYVLRDNQVHCVEEMQQIIETVWNEKPFSDPEAYFIANSILKRKFEGKDKTTSKFRKRQQKGCLPKIDKKDINIAYFGSSIDEYNKLPDRGLYPRGFWEDQRLAVLDLIVQSISASKRVKLFIRLHPNLINKPEERELWSFLYQLYPDRVHVINPQEKVDSYELSSLMDLNFIYHSSIGADIMSMGKPIYSMNTCTYDHLYGCSTVRDVSHIQSIVTSFEKDGCLFNKEEVTNNGLKFIYAVNNYGIPYKYYQPNFTSKSNRTHGKFMGITL